MSGPSVGLRDKVARRVKQLIEIARDKQCPDIEAPRVEYFTGRNAAGIACLEQNVLKLHTVLLEKNEKVMLNDTIAHEVAHLVVFNLAEHGAVSWKAARSHGKDWKYVMRHWFKIEPKRRHNFAMHGAGGNRQRQWGYSCECDTYQISTTRHNRIISGRQTYHCRKCSATIKRIRQHG